MFCDVLPAFELAGAGSAWFARSRSTSGSTCVIEHNQLRRVLCLGQGFTLGSPPYMTLATPALHRNSRTGHSAEAEDGIEPPVLPQQRPATRHTARLYVCLSRTENRSGCPSPVWAGRFLAPREKLWVSPPTGPTPDMPMHASTSHCGPLQVLPALVPTALAPLKELTRSPTRGTTGIFEKTVKLVALTRPMQ